MALYAITLNREIGVDVEYLREDLASLEIAERFFATREFEMIGALPPSCAPKVSLIAGRKKSPTKPKSGFQKRPRLEPKRAMRVLISLLLLVLAAAPSTSAQQNRALISGRVVDEAGKPIPNALVSLYIPPATGAFELIMPSAHALSGGESFIDSGSVALSKELKLFIEEPVPKGLMVAIQWATVWSAVPFTSFPRNCDSVETKPGASRLGGRASGNPIREDCH